MALRRIGSEADQYPNEDGRAGQRRRGRSWLPASGDSPSEADDDKTDDDKTDTSHDAAVAAAYGESGGE